MTSLSTSSVSSSPRLPDLQLPGSPRDAGRRSTRYSCAVNPPPSIAKMLKAVRKQGVRYSDKSQLVAALRSADPREYSDRGAHDDLFRFLSDHGAILHDEAVGEGDYFVDEAALQKVAKACQIHQPCVRPLPEAMRQRLLELAGPPVLVSPPNSPPPAGLADDEESDSALPTLARDDLEMVGADKPDLKDLPLPAALAFLSGVSTHSSVPMLNDIEQLGACKDSELVAYAAALQEQRAAYVALEQHIIEEQKRRAEEQKRLEAERARRRAELAADLAAAESRLAAAREAARRAAELASEEAQAATRLRTELSLLR